MFATRLNTRVLLPALLCSLCTLGMDLNERPFLDPKMNALCGTESLQRKLRRKHQYYVCATDTATSDCGFVWNVPCDEEEALHFRNRCATLRVVGSSYVAKQDFDAAFPQPFAIPQTFDETVKGRVEYEIKQFLKTVPKGTDVLVQWDADKVRDDKFTACLKGIALALGERFAGFYAVKRIDASTQYMFTPHALTGGWGREVFENGFVREKLVEALDNEEKTLPCYLQVAPVNDNRLYSGNDWGAYVSHMLASNEKPHMVLALGGEGCVAEATSKIGYARNAMLRYVDVKANGATGQFVTFAESDAGRVIGWREAEDIVWTRGLEEEFRSFEEERDLQLSFEEEREASKRNAYEKILRSLRENPYALMELIQNGTYMPYPTPREA